MRVRGIAVLAAVGLVALPLAMAFAIASGVPPQAGLYTAVVAGFLISALGGSRTQIGGPTGAFVVIVAGIVVKFGIAGLALVGVMAGVLLLIMGFTGLGTAVASGGIASASITGALAGSITITASAASVTSDTTTFSVTFTKTGTFNFYCALHGARDDATGAVFGMSGSITVLPAESED